MDTDIIIVGGGASGLMAGIAAAEEGANVLILEQQEKIGRKLSATGNGKCNFTNADMKVDYFFQSEGKEFAKTALTIFSVKRVLSFFEESGIAVTEKKGYYYPLSGQAEAVRESLLFRFLYGNSSIHKCKCNSRVIKIEKKDSFFYVYLEDGYQYISTHVILACGSMAAPQLGGSELGVILAKQMGHTIIPMLPALCGLKTSYSGWNKATNIRVSAKISIYAKKENSIPKEQTGKKELIIKKGTFIGTEQGELQITSYGISGILVFQLSGKVIRCLEQKEVIVAIIDFLPDKEEPFLLEFFKKQQKNYPLKPIISVLSGVLPEKLAGLILMETFGKQKKNKQETQAIQELKEEQIRHLIKKIHQFEIFITGWTGFEHAQTASGGVSTKEISSKTMESKLVSGLYFAGELIDIIGPCGGYNLQWAWASGYLAGKSAARNKN